MLHYLKKWKQMEININEINTESEILLKETD